MRLISSAAGMFIVFAMGMVLLGSVSHAQTAVSVKVEPALFEQAVNPGDRFSTSITITNSGSASQQFTVGIQDISGVDQNSQPIFSSSSASAYGLSSWVQLGATTVTVPSGGSVVVPFTIVVPENVGPGGHYGAIFISSSRVRPIFNGSGVGYEVGALIELRIAGDATEQAEVKEFSTDAALYQSPSVKFNATIANEGNVLLQPHGPIDVTNMFGQRVGSVIVNDQGASVFPGATRSFATSWIGSSFAFGQFSAVMTLDYGDTVNKNISASTSFWVIPVVPIIVVLASIIFFILIFVWSVKAYVRKRVSAMLGRVAEKERASVSEEEKLISGSGLPLSRLVFIVVATAIFALIFLLALFFFFG
jgi:hypothetical protein